MNDFDRKKIPRPSLWKGVFWGALIVLAMAVVFWFGPAPTVVN